MSEYFYFNTDENLCANESWLIAHLHFTEGIEEDEIINELHTKREYYGWYECQVSNDIANKFC